MQEGGRADEHASPLMKRDALITCEVQSVKNKLIPQTRCISVMYFTAGDV